MISYYNYIRMREFTLHEDHVTSQAKYSYVFSTLLYTFSLPYRTTNMSMFYDLIKRILCFIYLKLLCVYVILSIIVSDIFL